MVILLSVCAIPYLGLRKQVLFLDASPFSVTKVPETWFLYCSSIIISLYDYPSQWLGSYMPELHWDLGPPPIGSILDRSRQAVALNLPPLFLQSQ